MLDPGANPPLRRVAVALLLAAALAACASVENARPGRSLGPRPDQSLVFGSIRFFRDGKEYFPWDAFDESAEERHVRLMPLDHVAAAGEFWPGADGSLAIWIAPGDYALLGTDAGVSQYPPSFEVLALLRVPKEAVAVYAGEFVSETRTPRPEEGWVLSTRRFGAMRVQADSLPAARAALERRLGALPAEPVPSPWCVRADLPAFSDPGLRTRARELLDLGCPPAP